MNNALLFFTFLTVVVVLSIDASISEVSDFLIEFTTSFYGISFFVFVCMVFVIGSYVLFRFVVATTSRVKMNYLPLRALHITSLVTQVALVGIVVALLTQILLISEYHTILLIVATVVSAVVSGAIMIISSAIMASWYRFNKHSYVTLIFCLAFAATAYTFFYVAAIDTDSLRSKGQIITAESEVIYPGESFEPGSIRAIMGEIYQYSSTVAFLLFVAGCAILLHHYSRRIGRTRFWALVLLPSIYYVSTLVDTLGIYTPESDSEMLNYYLYGSLNGIIGGMLIGLSFWMISRTMDANKFVAGYLRLCSYGFILFSVATVGGVSVAAYPPFSLATLCMLALSSYMIILGLYSVAVSISQDVRLRQYIKELTKEDSGFLSTIAHAQLDRQIQAKASDLENVVEEQRTELEKESGIQSSIQEGDIKQYLLEVLQEVDKHKSTK